MLRPWRSIALWGAWPTTRDATKAQATHIVQRARQQPVTAAATNSAIPLEAAIANTKPRNATVPIEAVTQSATSEVWRCGRTAACLASCGTRERTGCGLVQGAVACPRILETGPASNATSSIALLKRPHGTRSGSPTSPTVWTAEGWLYVSAVVDMFSRRVVGWAMKPEMTAQLVTDRLFMAIWARGKPNSLLHHSNQGSQYSSNPLQRVIPITALLVDDLIGTVIVLGYNQGLRELGSVGAQLAGNGVAVSFQHQPNLVWREQ